MTGEMNWMKRRMRWNHKLALELRNRSYAPLMPMVSDSMDVDFEVEKVIQSMYAGVL
jgi:hypothetical protein